MRELNPKMRLFLDFLMLTVGSAIAAFAIEEFLVRPLGPLSRAPFGLFCRRPWLVVFPL